MADPCCVECNKRKVREMSRYAVRYQMWSINV